MANYQSGTNNIKLMLDISDNETPDFEEITPMTVGFETNSETDEWFDLLSEIANNVKVALNPTWSISMKFDKNDPVAKFILDKEMKVGKEATTNIKVVNMLKGETGEEITFVGLLDEISYDFETETVIEVEFELKVFDNKSFETAAYTV